MALLAALGTAIVAALPSIITMVGTIGAAATTVWLTNKLDSTLKPVDKEQKREIHDAVKKAVDGVKDTKKVAAIRAALPSPGPARDAKIREAHTALKLWHDERILPLATMGKQPVKRAVAPKQSLKAQVQAKAALRQKTAKGGARGFKEAVMEKRQAAYESYRLPPKVPAFLAGKGAVSADARKAALHPKGAPSEFLSKATRMVKTDKGTHTVIGFDTPNPMRQSRNTITAPAAQAWSVHESGALMHSYTQGGDSYLRVRHRELVGSVTGSANFATTLDAINPGLATSFPWLSVIADGFETYGFNDLAWLFCTSQSTSVAGALYTVVDADPLDLAPGSPEDFMNLDNACRGPAWELDLKYRVPHNILKRLPGAAPFFVRTGTTTHDLSVCDTGNFIVGTLGSGGASGALGELYVEYDITFATPHFSGDGPSQDVCGMYEIHTATDIHNTWADPTAGGTTKRFGKGVLAVATTDGDTSTAAFVLSRVGNKGHFLCQRAGFYVVKYRTVGTTLSGSLGWTMANAAHTAPPSASDVGSTIANGVANDNTNQTYQQNYVGDYFEIDYSGSAGMTDMNVTIIAISQVPALHHRDFGGGAKRATSGLERKAKYPFDDPDSQMEYAAKMEEESKIVPQPLVPPEDDDDDEEMRSMILEKSRNMAHAYVAETRAGRSFEDIEDRAQEGFRTSQALSPHAEQLMMKKDYATGTRDPKLSDHENNVKMIAQMDSNFHDRVSTKSLVVVDPGSASSSTTVGVKKTVKSFPPAAH